LNSFYDANGNTLSDAQGRSFTWDFENRLTQAVVPGTGTVAFKYDPFGRRIQKSSALGTTNYLYDGAGIIEELDGRVARPIAKRRAGPLSFFHHKRPVSTITDIQPLVGDNGDRPVSQGQGAPVHQDGPRSCSGPIVALFENWRRLAGVSEEGARCRNPERSEGSPTMSGRQPAAETQRQAKKPAKLLRNKYFTFKSFNPKI